jgi:hypothetical protein
MSAIARRDTYGRGGPPTGLVRAVEAEQSRGIVQATRVQAGEYVGRTALLAAALLSREEENCIRLAPLGEQRYKHIVDTFAMFAAGEIAGLRSPW